MTANPMHSAKSPEWYTPAEWVEHARYVLGGIDLDPASCEEAQRTVQAERYYTIADDGLRQPWGPFQRRRRQRKWRPSRVFVNPPGGDQGMVPRRFWRKAWAEYWAGQVEAVFWEGFNVSQLRTLQRCAPIGGSEVPSPRSTCLAIPRERIEFVRGFEVRPDLFEPEGRIEAVKPGAGAPHDNFAALIGGTREQRARFEERMGELGMVWMAPCALCGGDAAARVAQRWELTIPLEVGSQNSDRGKRRGAHNSGRDRWAYKQRRDGFVAALQLALLDQDARCDPERPRRRRVTITRLWGKRCREFDHGNLVGGCKPLVDALVTVGLLVDDSPEWFEGHYHQRKAPDGVGRTVIAVEELL